MAARTDNVTDPKLADALLLMRRGQAFWARKLNEVRDAEFDEPSLLPGWSRRALIAHVGFNARAVARLVEWARTGVETPMYESDTQRADEIAFGATLPTEALRNLAAHAAVHLNVEWRDLPAEAWSNVVRTAQGRMVPASETVWLRTREVWIHSLDLDNGARVDDFPQPLIDLLLDDLMAVWRRKRSDGDPNVVLEPIDRQQVYSVIDGAVGLVVRGTAVDLVGWGIGRSSRGVLTAEGAVPPEGTRMVVTTTTDVVRDVIDPRHYTGFLIRRTQQVHAAIWLQEVSAEVSSVQFGLLSVLAHRPGASQRELCDELDLDRSTIADLVVRLERRGLLERHRDGSDRRRNSLQLSAAGRVELDRLIPHVDEVEEVLTGGLDADDRQELRRLLGIVLASAGRAASPAAIAG